MISVNLNSWMFFFRMESLKRRQIKIIRALIEANQSAWNYELKMYCNISLFEDSVCSRMLIIAFYVYLIIMFITSLYCVY